MSQNLSLPSYCLGPLVLIVSLSASLAAAELPVLFADDFEAAAVDGKPQAWQPTDPAVWKITKTDAGNVYHQFKSGKYRPKHRSPYNISLIKDVVVGDFVFTAKVRSTNSKAGAHRDMCIFFSHQDPSHFYYVHLGKVPDPHSSQIMIVNGAPRKMITNNKSPGIPWDEKWHDVKVVRRVADGAIEIYFDDMKKPVMTARDKTFTWGRIGIGSFDDHGQWDDVKLRGVKVNKPK
ncbi:MAG: hypothetical protein U9N87_06930 [Planctomycetota bacterium]|nr:hypothetical protein [Planctomycetota bacterium]